MTYREIAPSPALASWIDCYWTRSAEKSAERVVHRILPDGCADVVFDLSGKPGPFSDAFAVGTMTRALLLELESGSTPELFGVRFKPGRAAAFFRVPLAELTDERVALADVQPLPSMSERLAASASDAQRVALVDNQIARVIVDAEVDRRVDAAIEEIIRSAGAKGIEVIARDVGISRQHLARKFLAEVGVTPKMFARVMRFRRLLEVADAGADWAELAARLGYFDQSHLIADFRELAGTTPVPFFQSDGAVRG